MEEKKLFYLLEGFLYKTENENLLIAIQGVNPIHKELKNYLLGKGLIMEYYIWGNYLFNSTKLETLISTNWKDGLKEGEHFFKIATSSELADFDQKLYSSSIASSEIEKNRILSFLRENLNSEEQEEAISLVLSAKNLKGKEKFYVMKKVQKYVKRLGELNTLFEVNKNFFKEYSKKEQEETK